HRPLEDSVGQGFFRQDLYYRINTLTLTIPALRERAEDILDLANTFLRQSSAANARSIRGFNQSAAAMLLDYEWPGNIRELQNAIERAVVLVPETEMGYELGAQDFAFLIRDTSVDYDKNLSKLSDAKNEFIKNYVKKAVLIHKGNKTKAAKAL